MNSAAVDSSRFSHLAVDIEDGDLWCERVTVCESATKDGTPKLLLRSYYRNRRTDERVWDEPPSGASRVRHATPEMRARGEEKLQELRLTLAMIPAEQKGPAAKKKRRGFFGMFQKKSNDAVEDSKDLNLQKAIALSISNESHSLRYEDGYLHDDDEEIALARALSLSADDY